MLQKRQDFEVKQADRTHSRQLDIEDQRQDFQAGQARIGREEGRQKEGRDAEKQKELEAIKQKNRIDELMAQHGLSEKDAALKYKQERAKEERDHKYKVEEQNFKYGADVQLEKLRGQNREHSGAAHLDPAIASRTKDLDGELASLFRQKEDIQKDVVMKDDERTRMMAKIDEKIVAARNRKNQMLALPPEAAEARNRPGYKFPD